MESAALTQARKYDIDLCFHCLICNLASAGQTLLACFLMNHQIEARQSGDARNVI